MLIGINIVEDKLGKVVNIFLMLKIIQLFKKYTYKRLNYGGILIMKKNKTIAYMLAAALLVGGTFVGTKALFIDVENTIGELAISTGDVDIKVETIQEWKLDRNGFELADGTTVKSDDHIEYTEIVDENGRIKTPNNDDTNEAPEKENTPFANNLKPGDEIVKTLSVTNVGTLIANIELTEAETIEAELKEQGLDGLVEVTSTLTEDNTSDLFMPGERAQIELRLKIKDKGGQHNKDGFNSDDYNKLVVDLNGAWQLNATQQNPNKLGE